MTSLSYRSSRGDYRRDHEGGTGRSTLPPDPVPDFEPCRRFRLELASQARRRNG